MMIDSIRSFFESHMHLAPGNGQTGNHGGQGSTNPREAREGEEQRRLHIAACALLLELAHADDDFADVERDHIEAVLRRHFALDEDAALELMRLAEAERAHAVDLYQFTSLVRDRYDLGQKTLLAEIMWGLILADGRIDRDEATLLRKIANLLDLQPGYLAAAKKRAEEEE